MIRAAAYIRVSTSEQAIEGDSIPAQRTAIRTYIDKHENMIMAGEYIDAGESGTKDTRSALNQLLRDVSAKKIDIILVTKLDRLYRSIRHYLNMMEVLDKNNVGWLAIWEPIYDTTTPQGRLIVNQMMSIAQFEAENTGQRIRQVFDYKISQGQVVSGKIPLGYSIVNKRLVPNEDAEIVRALFRHYDTHNNLHELKRYSMEVLGCSYRMISLKYVLMNKKYIGVHRKNDHYCEPIIDRDLFERVQRKLSMNIKKGRKNEYIFSGLLRCSACGGAYCGITEKRKRVDGSIRVSPRYRCTGYFTVSCRGNVSIAEGAIEEYLLENVRDLLRDRELRWKVKQKEISRAVNTAEKYEKKLERLKELFVNGLISLDEYKKDAEQLRAKLEENRTEAAPPRPIELPEGFDELYETMTVSEKRRLWQAVIEKIVIYPDRSLDVFFCP